MTRSMRAFWFSLIAFGGALACSPPKRPDGGSGLLGVGQVAPDVTGYGESGEATRLSASRGHAAVVYFYPRDGTPGCTKEACAFRDAWEKYAARSVQVFGVSRDSRASHDAFRKEHRLPFPLVPDVEGETARAYGVGSLLGMTQRVTFLVGADGRVAAVWRDVDPGVHATEILAAIEEKR